MQTKLAPELRPTSITGPLITNTRCRDTKDPCIVYDGNKWHIYGSGGDVRSEKWCILHATAPRITGPWKEEAQVTLNGLKGDHVAAPSVHYDDVDNCFHMVVQTEFTTIGGTIEYLRSTDGYTFTRIDTILESIPDSSEAGIYDPHQSIIGENKYIVYAGTPAVEKHYNQYIIQPDVHLAECENSNGTCWAGPWKRQGIILDHDHISWHHNPRGHETYEWGIEGPQIILLPNGKYLLNATCFLSEGEFGTRQRVFFGLADTITGPYESMGPVIDPILYPEFAWLSGENGHATVMVWNDQLYLFFQSRGKMSHYSNDTRWQYGMATFSLSKFD